jgi:hypothetical protein
MLVHMERVYIPTVLRRMGRSRTESQKQLAEAETRVRKRAALVQVQRDRIARLRAEGQSTEHDERLLAEFEQLLAIQIHLRDRLLEKGDEGNLL